jgi:hypothetical protein
LFIGWQLIERRAFCDQEFRFAAAEEAVSQSEVKSPSKTKDIAIQEKLLEEKVNHIIGAEEREIASVFNSGKNAAKHYLSSDGDAKTKVALANAMVQQSNNSEGWLSFFSSTARGSLPALSTVKPKRIVPFEREKKKKSVVASSTTATIENEGANDSSNNPEDSSTEKVVTSGELATRRVPFDPSNYQISSEEGNYRIVPRSEFSSAVSSAKSAALQALQRVKDGQFIVAGEGSEYDPGDTTLHERFGMRHVVYPVDIQFYEDHQSVEAMAAKFCMEIKEYEFEIENNDCGFEWFISRALTAHEIEMRDRKMVSRADSAAKMVEM